MSQTLFLLYRPEPTRPMLKARSVGAHSICARRSLPYRKRARADMESAPTFFVVGGAPAQRRRPAWSFLFLSKTKSVGAHSICARRSLSYRKRARADMESAPTFFCRGGEGRVFACCACKRIYLLLSRVPDKIRRFTQKVSIDNCCFCGEKSRCGICLRKSAPGFSAFCNTFSPSHRGGLVGHIVARC